MNKIRVIAYSLFVGNAGTDGPHMSLSMTDQLKKFEAHLRLGRTSVSDGSDVLRLFIAPEWYFSQSATNYQPSELGMLIAKLLAMSESFPEVLIIPGSIAWSLPFELDPTPTPQAPKKSWNPFRKKEKTPVEPEVSQPFGLEMNPAKKSGEIVYNTVPVIRNKKIVHIYHKRIEGGEIKEKDRGKKFGFQFPIPGFGTMDRFENTGVFVHEGIKFGLEVCADHKQGTLINKDLGLPDNPTIENVNDAGVDVQVIVACGSAIANGRIGTRPGGHVLLVDSSGPKGLFFATKVLSRSSVFAGKFQHKLDPSVAMKSTEFIPKYCKVLADNDPDERLSVLKDLIEL